MDINVDVKDALVVAEQFENTENNVWRNTQVSHGMRKAKSAGDTIDIAESRGLRFLGVVQSTRPIDGNVAFVPR